MLLIKLGNMKHSQQYTFDKQADLWRKFVTFYRMKVFLIYHFQ